MTFPQGQLKIKKHAHPPLASTINFSSKQRNLKKYFYEVKKKQPVINECVTKYKHPDFRSKNSCQKK